MGLHDHESDLLYADKSGAVEDRKLKLWKFFTLVLLLVTYTGAYLTYNCLSVATPMITSQLGYTNEQVCRFCWLQVWYSMLGRLVEY